MNRPPNKSKKIPKAIRLWTLAQARSAVPYIRSVMTSLRAHRLDVQGHRRRARLLARRPGRPDRAALIEQEDTLQEARRAHERFGEALQELSDLDIYCVDPLGGLALIPFVQKEKLAWMVFDLFGDDVLGSWRYHDDPLDTRRPIAEAAKEGTATSLAI
jgi:hypothetical protein